MSAAFDEFVKEAGDRPIILAGHSQGALHLMRLLREKVAGKPIAKRLVAAYVVGWPIDTSADLPAVGIPACATAEDTGCILSWMSFRDPANPSLILDQWKRTEGLTGAEKRDLVELRRRNRVLEMEIEILKRASAYFARENVLPKQWPGWSVSWPWTVSPSRRPAGC